MIELFNVGEQASFDVEFSELRMVVRTPTENVRRFAFRPEPILLAGERRQLRRTGARLLYSKDHEWLLKLFETSHETISAHIGLNDHLLQDGEFDPGRFVGMGVQPMNARYRNARGKQFEQASLAVVTTRNMRAIHVE